MPAIQSTREGAQQITWPGTSGGQIPIPDVPLNQQIFSATIYFFGPGLGTVMYLALGDPFATVIDPVNGARRLSNGGTPPLQRGNAGTIDIGSNSNLAAAVPAGTVGMAGVIYFPMSTLDTARG